MVCKTNWRLSPGVSLLRTVTLACRHCARLASFTGLCIQGQGNHTRTHTLAEKGGGPSSPQAWGQHEGSFMLQFSTFQGLTCVAEPGHQDLSFWANSQWTGRDLPRFSRERITVHNPGLIQYTEHPKLKHFLLVVWDAAVSHWDFYRWTILEKETARFCNECDYCLRRNCPY